MISPLYWLKANGFDVNFDFDIDFDIDLDFDFDNKH